MKKNFQNWASIGQAKPTIFGWNPDSTRSNLSIARLRNIISSEKKTMKREWCSSQISWGYQNSGRIKIHQKLSVGREVWLCVFLSSRSFVHHICYFFWRRSFVGDVCANRSRESSSRVLFRTSVNSEKKSKRERNLRGDSHKKPCVIIRFLTGSSIPRGHVTALLDLRTRSKRSCGLDRNHEKMKKNNATQKIL